VPDVLSPRRTVPGSDRLPGMPAPSPEAPLLETALARSFELVAGFALFALVGTAIVVVLIPSSSSGRVGFAVVLVGIGIALVALALSLSRRSAYAVKRPLETLDNALAAITGGDLTVRVTLEGAAAEIQFVGNSVNTMVRELTRLRVIEIERATDQRVRRELAEVVHASLDREHVVQRAVEVVGDALEVDRAHVRLLDREHGRLAAEWRRTDAIVGVTPLTPLDEIGVLRHLIGVTDDGNAVVINDTRDAARFSTEQREAFAASSMRAALKYPIMVGERVAGALVVSEQGTARHWTDSEVTLMEGFAGEIGRALDHALAFEMQHEMAERLGVLDRSKNEFLSEVSRELRGPLASVLGYIEILTDESADAVTPEQRRMLAAVERNGDKLLVLISNLKTMSRMEAGEFEPKLAPVHVAGLIERVRDAVSTACSKGSLELIVDVQPGLELFADERQVERALHNLVSNAVRFTPRRGRIEIVARSEGAEVVIDVRDTGCGIAADEQDGLFTRFFRSTGERRRETLGAGLGLYIVKQIVDGHEGRLSVVSAAGQGSTFTMRLPVRPARAGRRATDHDAGDTIDLGALAP
jgi:two-component system phosphate regulon sensor histidine kinase PhoR